MRIMGLDVGSKTVGVAVSDPFGWTAQGLEIIRIDEAKEEFGIEVKVIRKQYENIIPEKLAEYIFLCEYVSGEFGTGSGPEFSNDPAYADRGEYLPEIVDKNKIKDLPLIPEILKEKIVKDIAEGKI